MKNWQWGVCLGIHALIAFGIYVYYATFEYPFVMVTGIAIIILLDFITIIRQNSKSYHKEVGEYDYDKDNFQHM